MTSWIRLYARGFLYSPQPVEMFEGLPHFDRHTLAGGELYVDQLAECALAAAGDDWLVVIGKAFPLSTGVLRLPNSGNGPAPGTQLAEALFDVLQRDGLPGLEAALYDVGGRHAIILRTGGTVHAYQDAAGHRSVYFNTTQIASHFDMLRHTSPPATEACPVSSRSPATSPDGLWDATEHPAIFALLANHRLDVAAGTQERFGLRTANPFRILTWQDRLAQLHDLMQEHLDQIYAASPHSPLGVSLSGGLDSRTVLAHLRSRRDRTRAFTYTASNVATGKTPTGFWQRTVVTDHNVLAQLADHLPEDFHVIIKPTNDQLTEADRAILARNTVGTHGWHYLTAYRDLFVDPRSIHVRGNFVEMGRLIRGDLTLPTRQQRFERVAEEIIRRRRPPAGKYRAFFRTKAQELGYDQLADDVEFTDAYHWENRSSRWYAEIANETDTVFDSIVPVNVRRIYELLISPRLDTRPTAQLQYDLIHRAWPELLAYGINTEDNRYESDYRPRLPD